MFGRVTITLGIGPHSTLVHFVLTRLIKCVFFAKKMRDAQKEKSHCFGRKANIVAVAVVKDTEKIDIMLSWSFLCLLHN